MFTQRHYIAIAAVLKSTRPAMPVGTDLFGRADYDARTLAWSNLVTALADKFAERSAFKRALFVRACGGNEQL